MLQSANFRVECFANIYRGGGDARSPFTGDRCAENKLDCGDMKFGRDELTDAFMLEEHGIAASRSQIPGRANQKSRVSRRRLASIRSIKDQDSR